MRKLVAAFAIAAISISTLAGCSKKQAETNTQTQTNTQTESDTNKNEESVTITHEKGETVVSARVKKAVIFELSVLDIIDTLGVDIELGLPSGLPTYLETYGEDAVNVGSMKEANMEAIYEFAPDVIFISGRLADYYDELSKIAPTVYLTTGADTYMEDVKKNVSDVAAIFDKTVEANEKLTVLEEKVESVKAIAENSADKGLILLANEGSLSAYGKGSRYGFIHDTLNVSCADENIQVSTHGQEASYEYISQVNPDIIFVVDRTAAVGGSVDASETLNNDLVNGTSAAQQGKIISLNSEIWYLAPGGLNSTTIMIDEVASAFAE